MVEGNTPVPQTQQWVKIGEEPGILEYIDHEFYCCGYFGNSLLMHCVTEGVREDELGTLLGI